MNPLRREADRRNRATNVARAEPASTRLIVRRLLAAAVAQGLVAGAGMASIRHHELVHLPTLTSAPNTDPAEPGGVGVWGGRGHGNLFENSRLWQVPAQDCWNLSQPLARGSEDGGVLGSPRPWEREQQADITVVVNPEEGLTL